VDCVAQRTTRASIDWDQGKHDRPLLVEYTGNFPGVGATGGYGAEIDYDTVYPSQLEEQILGFVKLAIGA